MGVYIICTFASLSEIIYVEKENSEFKPVKL